MQKTLTPKRLPEQVYGMKQREFRLKRQIPWQRLSELRAYQRGGEEPKPFTPAKSYVAPVKKEPVTRISSEMQVRRSAQEMRLIEKRNWERERNKGWAGVSRKQSFFNITHTIE